MAAGAWRSSWPRVSAPDLVQPITIGKPVVRASDARFDRLGVRLPGIAMALGSGSQLNAGGSALRSN